MAEPRKIDDSLWRDQVAELKTEVQRLRTALSVYADLGNWEISGEEGNLDRWMGEGYNGPRLARDVLLATVWMRPASRHNLAERVTDEDADEDPPCLCTRRGDYEDVRGCPVHDA